MKALLVLLLALVASPASAALNVVGSATSFSASNYYEAAYYFDFGNGGDGGDSAACWVYTSWDSTTEGVFIGWGDSTGGDQYQLHAEYDGTADFEHMSDTAGAATVHQHTATPTGGWRFLSGRFSGTSANNYLGLDTDFESNWSWDGSMTGIDRIRIGQEVVSSPSAVFDNGSVCMCMQIGTEAVATEVATMAVGGWHWFWYRPAVAVISSFILSRVGIEKHTFRDGSSVEKYGRTGTAGSSTWDTFTETGTVTGDDALPPTFWPHSGQ